MKRPLVGLLTLVAFAAAACGYSDPYAGGNTIANESPGASAALSPSPGTDDCHAGAGLPSVTYPDGLKVVDLAVGTGATAKSGYNISVQYTGWLSSCGQPFDTSRQPGRTPFAVQLGQGQVIPGWDEGIPGMKVGGRRMLTIPPALAYGAQGQTDPNTGATIIPPNATLIFAIELLSAAPGPSPSPTPKTVPSPTPSPSGSPSASPS